MTKDSSSTSTDPTFANAGPGTYRIPEGELSLQNLGPTGAVKESINNGDSLTSTNYSTNVNLKELVPIKSYENAELFKETILKESRNQSGIYRWVNNLNKKSYVGSGIDLAKRLRSYYNKNELNRNPRPIKDALVKYGHNNFTVDI